MFIQTIPARELNHGIHPLAFNTDNATTLCDDVHKLTPSLLRPNWPLLQTIVRYSSQSSDRGSKAALDAV